MLSKEEMAELCAELDNVQFDGENVRFYYQDGQELFCLPFDYTFEVELDRHIRYLQGNIDFYNYVVRQNVLILGSANAIFDKISYE